MAMRTTDRSARMEQAYDRATVAFRPPAGGATTGATFTAAGAYDKLGMLVLVALLTGAIGYATASTALLVVGLVAGLVLHLIGIFRPGSAKIVAPLYAVAEGLCLGSLTALYATGTSGVAPLAVIFTAGIFVGALVVFRSGLVKVTPKFVSLTVMAGFGFMLAILAGMFGLLPGLAGQSGLLVVGLIGIGIGVLYLFIDFSYVASGRSAAYRPTPNGSAPSSSSRPWYSSTSTCCGSSPAAVGNPRRLPEAAATCAI